MHASRNIAIVIFILFSVLYIGTACPTVYTMDNGELIVAAYGLKIAHPTGYPLFCILGKIGTLLIPFGSIAWRVNALNAIIAAGAVSIAFLALSEVVRRRYAVFSAALFGVSPVFWGAATSAEVHSLSVLLIATQLLLVLRWRACRDNRLLMYLAVVSGLALTNHLSSILIMPGLLWGILQCDKSILRNRAIVLKSVLLFLLPLCLYLYLPLRAEASRGSIWGDLYQSVGFIGHITGRQFRNLMFHSSSEEIRLQIMWFLKLLVTQYPIYLIWAIGLGAILIKHRGLIEMFGTMIALNVAYNINYAIIDIDEYYLATFLVMTFFVAAAVEHVGESVKTPVGQRVAAAVLPVIVIAAAITTFPRADKHDAYYIMDHAQNTMKTLPQNALYVACGDASFNAMLYERVVEGKRQDLIFLHRNITKIWPKDHPTWAAQYYYESASTDSPVMSWYRWPNHYSRDEIRSERFLRDVIAEVIKERPVYIGCIGNEYYVHPIAKLLEEDFVIIPEGVTYRVYPKSEKPTPQEVVKINEKLWKSYELRGIYTRSFQSRFEREVPDLYAMLYLAYGDYALKSGLYKPAEYAFTQALRIDPHPKAKNGLAVSLACQHRYKDAEKVWQTILAENPKDRTALRGLAMIQKEQPLKGNGKKTPDSTDSNSSANESASPM